MFLHSLRASAFPFLIGGEKMERTMAVHQHGYVQTIDKSDQQGTSGGKPQRAGKDAKGESSQRLQRTWLFIRKSASAYGGSLVGTSVAFPIFALGATVCFYLTPPFPLPLLPQDVVSVLVKSAWYAPVYGFLVTCVALLLFAAFRYRFATARGANMHVYGILKSRHSELTARLGGKDVINCKPEESLQKMQELFGIDGNDHYRIEALRKARGAYHDLDQSLFHNHCGVEWALGTGYTTAWRIVHRAQEALIEVEATQEVIADVIHDVDAIKSSAMSNCDSLIEKSLLAVKDLCPEAMEYFADLKSNKNYADLFKENAAGQPTRSKEMALETIRQVKHSLNVYQDNLRATLVRARNHLSVSIALTGFVTHLLLCIVILIGNSPDANKAANIAAGMHSAIIAATAYYMVGAVAGLFGRFYNEANSGNAPDDYGLFLSRLVATPLLSGLAAIGGVLITATLPTLDGLKAPELGAIFNNALSMEYLFAAAIFGFTPNLIIKSFQQRAQKYATDLQNSKGEGTSKGE